MGSNGTGPETLRVAMVVQAFRPQIGGAERQIERLAPALAERGVEVYVVTRRPPGTPAAEHLDGLEVRRVGVPARPAAASVAYTGGASALLWRLRPDLIHVHGLLSPASVGLIAGTAMRVPVVAKVLSSGDRGDIDRLLAKPLGRTRLRLLAERFAALIALAEESERELVEHGVDPKRVHRIPNGVDTRRFRPPAPGERERLRAELGLPSGEPLALYCGRVIPEKRVVALAEAFGRVTNGRLVVVGGGSDEPRLRAVAQTSALRDRVLVRGAVDDPSPYYRAADLYVSASGREGMSGSVLEAMASGLPTVAAPAGGMEGLLAGGVGSVLDDADPRTIAPAVDALLGDESLRRRMGAAARRRAESEYSLAATADRLVGLYGDLL